MDPWTTRCTPRAVSVLSQGSESDPRVRADTQIEGFSAVPYRLPQSTDEGGCYAVTCASIAAMMTAERLLSHRLDGKVRDTMELCLYNAVLGGGSLDGKAFAYANKLATYGDETAIRNDWFEGGSFFRESTADRQCVAALPTCRALSA